MGLFDIFRNLFKADKGESEREMLRRQGIIIPSEEAKRETEESIKDFQEIIGQHEADRKRIERDQKSWGIEEGLYPYPKVFLKEKKRFIRDAFQKPDFECPKCGKVFSGSNKYWDHPCVTSDVHTKEFFERAEKEAREEIALKQYPQTADFFRVVEKEDENKFPFNKIRGDVIPSISEEQIRTVLPELGGTETIKESSSLLSKAVQFVKERINFGEGKELAMEMSDIKSEGQALQQLVDKLTVQLADWWGIPNYRPLSIQVKIFNKEENEGLEKIIPLAGIVHAGGKTIILVNEEYLQREFKSGIINIKSALAEEVCHSLEEEVSDVYGRSIDKYVDEFFGIISRFYISEQNLELFHEEYKKYLHRAANFSIERKQFEDKFKQLNEEKRRIQIEMGEGRSTDFKRLEEIEKEERYVKNELDHLSYYPAAAYYYEVKAMSQQQRFELLMKSPQEIKNNIIEGKMVGILEEIGKKVGERDRHMMTEAVLTDLKIEQTPETAPFFQKTEEDASRERLASEVIAYKQEERNYEKEKLSTEQSFGVINKSENEIFRDSIKGLENVGGFFQRAASEIGKAAYGRVAEAVAAKLEQHEQEPAIETGEVTEEYPQEEEYEEPAEEEYQESGEYENVPPPLPRIVINIPDKIPKNLAKKLESRGIKIPKNKIK
jgi:hypothetical protein